MIATKTVQDASADVFTAIAHPVRRGILDALAAGDANVQDLAAPFEVSRSAISQHLSILRESGLVTSERQGRQQVYRLEGTSLGEVYDWVAKYEKFWNEKLDALGSYLDERSRQEDGSDEA